MVQIKNAVITSCGNSLDLAKKVAKKTKTKFVPLQIGEFPDGDIYLRFMGNLKGKVLYLFQSFQPNPNQSLFNIIFAAETAKQHGVKKVVLVAPYLAFIRQDKCFHSGECVSAKIMAKLLKSVDKLVTVDPHLHRYKSLKEIFPIPTKQLSSNDLIAQYIGKKFKNAVILGPDAESYQWAETIAKKINADVTILKKTRYSPTKVKVEFKNKILLKGREVVIIDDIISTGGTIVGAAKAAKKAGAKSVSVICIHGVFANDAMKKLKKAGLKKIVSTNTINHKTNKIDIGELIANGLK